MGAAVSALCREEYERDRSASLRLPQQPPATTLDLSDIARLFHTDRSLALKLATENAEQHWRTK